MSTRHMGPSNAFNTDVPLPHTGTPRLIPLPLHTSNEDSILTTTVRNAAPQSPHNIIYPDVHAQNTWDTPTVISPIRSSLRNQQEQSTWLTSPTQRHPKKVRFARNIDIAPIGTNSTASTSASPSTRSPHRESLRGLGDINVAFSTVGQTTELNISGPSPEAALNSLSQMLPLLFMSKHVSINLDIDGGSMDDQATPNYDADNTSSIQGNLEDCKVQSLKWCGRRDIFSAIWYPICSGLHHLTHLTIDFNRSIEPHSLRKLIISSQYLEAINLRSEMSSAKSSPFLGAQRNVKNLKILTIKSTRVSLTNFLQSLQFNCLSHLDLGILPDQADSSTIVTGLLEAFIGATYHGRLDRQLRIVYPMSADRTSAILFRDSEQVDSGWKSLEDPHPTNKDWLVFRARKKGNN